MTELLRQFRWLEPAGGLQQQYRLVDALLETGVELSYAWKDVNVIPARTLPPRALVVAVTPLLDERSVAALVDLRGRGHDLVVLEVSPEPFVDPGTEPGDLLALRVWRLQRAELRSGARFETHWRRQVEEEERGVVEREDAGRLHFGLRY